MRLKLLRLLVVAIALAVPFQGMAAIAAGLCMAFGDHGAAAGQGHTHHSSVPVTEEHSTHSHSHGDEADSQANGDEGDTGSAHCGPCAACCASASIAGPSGISIPSPASYVLYVFSQFPPFGHQPDALDRPPLAL